MKDARRKFKRLVKAIKNAWPQPRTKRPKSANGDWVTHRGEDLGTLEIDLRSSKAGQQMGVQLSNETKK